MSGHSTHHVGVPLTTLSLLLGMQKSRISRWQMWRRSALSVAGAGFDLSAYVGAWVAINLLEFGSQAGTFLRENGLLGRSEKS